MSPSSIETSLPSLHDILREHPGWLDEAVDTGEASRTIGFAQPSLETMRTRGGGPPFFKRGKKVLYTRRLLFEWLAAGRRSSTSDPGPEVLEVLAPRLTPRHTKRPRRTGPRKPWRRQKVMSSRGH